MFRQRLLLIPGWWALQWAVVILGAAHGDGWGGTGSPWSRAVWKVTDVGGVLTMGCLQQWMERHWSLGSEGESGV